MRTERPSLSAFLGVSREPGRFFQAELRAGLVCPGLAKKKTPVQVPVVVVLFGARSPKKGERMADLRRAPGCLQATRKSIPPQTPRSLGSCCNKNTPPNPQKSSGRKCGRKQTQ